MKEYIRVNTKSKSVLTKFKLSQVDGLLSENNFLRIHRSFIVAKDKIEAFSATEVELGGKRLPIGRTYKEQSPGDPGHNTFQLLTNAIEPVQPMIHRFAAAFR